MPCFKAVFPTGLLERNLSVLFWGCGRGLQDQGELNTEFTSPGMTLAFRHQSSWEKDHD